MCNTVFCLYVRQPNWSEIIAFNGSMRNFAVLGCRSMEVCSYFGNIIFVQAHISARYERIWSIGVDDHGKQVDPLGSIWSSSGPTCKMDARSVCCSVGFGCLFIEGHETELRGIYGEFRPSRQPNFVGGSKFLGIGMDPQNCAQKTYVTDLIGPVWYSRFDRSTLACRFRHPCKYWAENLRSERGSHVQRLYRETVLGRDGSTVHGRQLSFQWYFWSGSSLSSCGLDVPMVQFEDDLVYRCYSSRWHAPPTLGIINPVQQQDSNYLYFQSASLDRFQAWKSMYIILRKLSRDAANYSSGALHPSYKDLSANGEYRSKLKHS